MDMNTGLPFETVKLVTLGRSRSVFEKLLTEVVAVLVPFRSLLLRVFAYLTSIRVFVYYPSTSKKASHEALEKERHHTVVFKSWGSEWHPFGKPR